MNVLRSLIIVFLVLYLKEILVSFQIFVAPLMQQEGMKEGERRCEKTVRDLGNIWEISVHLISSHIHLISLT